MKTLKFRTFDRIERLKRRREFLNGRIDKNYLSAGARDYDLAEISALNWAIPILETHVFTKAVLMVDPDHRLEVIDQVPEHIRLEVAERVLPQSARRACLMDLQMAVSINKTPEQNETDVLKLISRWEESFGS